MANQGFSRIFSWCETPPGVVKEVECACVPIHNASKLQNLPIDPDLETICNAGDTLVFDGTEWGCRTAVTGHTGFTGPTGPTGPQGDTGPTGCDCDSATGFLTPSDCIFDAGTGLIGDTQSSYTRINNVNTIQFSFPVINAGTDGIGNREMAIICDFPSLPPHEPTAEINPGAVGALAIFQTTPILVTGVTEAITTTTVRVVLFTEIPLTGTGDNTLHLQAIFTYN